MAETTDQTTTDPLQVLRELDAYCALTGDEPKTVARKATGNGRFLTRILSRADRTQRDHRKIRAYIAANPAPAAPSTPDDPKNVPCAHDANPTVPCPVIDPPSDGSQGNEVSDG